MVKQLRIPFPDYPAEQQENDAKRAERLKQTDVYMSKVDGAWSALIPRKHNIVINSNIGEELADFCKNLIDEMEEDFKIKPRFRCIQNVGIDEYLRKNQAILRSFQHERD